VNHKGCPRSETLKVPHFYRRRNQVFVIPQVVTILQRISMLHAPDIAQRLFLETAAQKQRSACPKLRMATYFVVAFFCLFFFLFFVLLLLLLQHNLFSHFCRPGKIIK